MPRRVLGLGCLDGMKVGFEARAFSRLIQLGRNRAAVSVRVTEGHMDKGAYHLLRMGLSFFVAVPAGDLERNFAQEVGRSDNDELRDLCNTGRTELTPCFFYGFSLFSPHRTLFSRHPFVTFDPPLANAFWQNPFTSRWLPFIHSILHSSAIDVPPEFVPPRHDDNDSKSQCEPNLRSPIIKVRS